MESNAFVRTPLMLQYHKMKKKYPGAILLFRVGDFYETFDEDAVKVSRILDIILTKRSNGNASSVPLAGFPYHSLDTYLPKLIKAGCRIAICEQLEDAKKKQTKGLVKRGVTEFLTPGTAIDEKILETKQNNYLSALYWENDVDVGVSFLDISTGDFFTDWGTIEDIKKLIDRFQPKEFIFSKSQKKKILNYFPSFPCYFAIDDWFFSIDYALELLKKKFEVHSLQGFGIEDNKASTISSGAILHYLKLNPYQNTIPIKKIYRIHWKQYVLMDNFTIDSLEILEPQRKGGVSLVDILDHCKTAMGSRLLKKWLIMPIKESQKIKNRLSVVDYFYNHPENLEATQKLLSQIIDIERISAKIAVKKIYPKQLKQFQQSLQIIDSLKILLSSTQHQEIIYIIQKIDACQILIDKIERYLTEDPPLYVHQGNLIRAGVHPQLDMYRKIISSSKEFLLDLQKKETKKTGISSLKIAFNRIFGYYFEVRNTHKDKVPSYWTRKQTLINAERYITEELKEYEEKILQAEEKIQEIEQELFNEIVDEAQNYISIVRKNALYIATLDCLTTFAFDAIENHYSKPELTEKDEIEILQGRHPVIEQCMPLDMKYVPNDIFLDRGKHQILLITGPNMSGKSALLRQVALIILMVHIGSFVPAKQVKTGIIDKIFTRVGASDNISKGESTFMLEMTETATILNNLTSNSLVLMDEIGRGTSTFDGLSIAWGVIHYLHQQKDIFPKVLFATHYHELVVLAAKLPRVESLNVAVKEVADKIIFLRKLQKGGTQRSFGIQVAKIAGIPIEVTLEAEKILHTLEKKKWTPNFIEEMDTILEKKEETNSILITQATKLLKKIEALDLNTLTPIEALLKLSEYKHELEKKGD